MSSKENNKSNSEITDKGSKELTNNENSLKYEIFKNNVFSEKGLNKYIKHITKDIDIRKYMISILSEENCNERNLNLIKLSEKKLEAKQKYNTINGLFFSLVLTLYPVVLELARNRCDKLLDILFLIIFGIITTFTYLYIIYYRYKKPEEKRAEAYFWLETEMEKRIKESKE